MKDSRFVLNHYARCIRPGCEERTGHRSGICEHHRRVKCRCGAEFVKRAHFDKCAECMRTAREFAGRVQWV